MLSCEQTSLDLAVDMLVLIVRKQPTWLHRVAQHSLLRELLRLLRQEGEVVVLVPAILVLASLLPALAAKIGQERDAFPELFTVFSRLCQYKYREAAGASELYAGHLTVALYSYFHRLYGMFPCNFLSHLRQHYYDTNTSPNSVFSVVISPMISSVRMHPLLVTQTREFERSTSRWKGLAELHDVVAECSRYALDSGDEVAGRPVQLYSEAGRRGAGQAAGLLDSPPEAAVEATPDNTPYTTPSKEFSHTRLPRPGLHVKNLTYKSPGPASPTKTVTSPTKDTSPFKFPGGEPGDAFFDTVPAAVLSKRDSLGLGLSSFPIRLKSQDAAVDTRPSPVRFTEQPQVQVSPVKPCAESAGVHRAALLSMAESQQDGAGETDAEVSSITGSLAGTTGLGGLSTRRITPHIFPDSSATSRTLSRISTECEAGEDRTGDRGGAEGGAESVSRLVSQVMRRVRRITLCEEEEESSGPGRALARSLSCPALSIASDTPSPATTEKLRFSSGTQTESPQPKPYEHLFPFALPLQGGVRNRSDPPDLKHLLDYYIEGAFSSTANRKDLKAQLKLLRSQLQFEIGRREILGSRNRRLLGFTKNVRELEEKVNSSIKIQTTLFSF